MRDGIYKGLKLDRRWRTLLRRCERPADRDSRAQPAALAALEREFRRDVSSATVRQFLLLADSAASLLPGFSPRDPIRRPRLRNVPGQTPLEDALSRHLRRILSTGVRGQEAVHNTLRDALREWGMRRSRQITEHCFAEAGNDAHNVTAAVEGAIRAIDCDDVAARLIRNEKAARPEKHPIDPDEDLLGRRSNADHHAFR